MDVVAPGQFDGFGVEGKLAANVAGLAAASAIKLQGIHHQDKQQRPRPKASWQRNAYR